MDAVSDSRIREVVVMKSAQVGWSELLLNTVGFFVDLDPSPILMVQPTVEMSTAFSKDRLAPMVRDTPALTGRISDARSRDSGNTTLHKTFPGGHITIVGANSPAGLASRPIRVVLFDEVDRFEPSAGSEGDPVALAKKRSTTFWNRKILMGSTPTIKGESRIEAAFEQGDQRYYMVPCPHCRMRQRLVWAQVRWDDGKPETARYVCQHCGVMLGDADKAQMLREGDWEASKPFNGIASYHISEIYSPWVTWGEMALSFLENKKLPHTLQTWINTSLGETWEDKGESLEPKGLLARRESYTDNSLPSGVLMLTAGTDCQDDRLEHTVWGWGRDEECWRVSHTVLRGDPGSQALWTEHDLLLRKKFRTDDGRELVIEACAIDSGGHYSTQVVRYANERKRFRVWAVKGAAGMGRLAWPKRASKSKKTGTDVYIVGVDTIKDLLYGRIKRVTEPGPGYVHLDASADDIAAEQITSEVIVFRLFQGRKVRAFKPRSSSVRNEQLDTFVYAYAAMVGRGGAAVVDRRTTVQVEEPVVEIPLTQSQQFRRRTPPPQPRRGSWATGWNR
jgi:phage terminase large subunit GpA-like protein